MRAPPAFFVPAGLIVAACSTPAPNSERTLEIVVLVDGARCGLRIGSAEYWDSPSESAAIQLAKLLPDDHRPIRLTNTVSTPFRCIGGAIYEMQRLGHRRIAFISESPPALPPSDQH